MEMILGMTKYDEYREKFIERKTIEDISEDNNCVFCTIFRWNVLYGYLQTKENI